MFPVSVPFENFCFLSMGGDLLGTLGRDALDDGFRTPAWNTASISESGHSNPLNRANNKPICP
ncbi:MAG: hypothetical protein IPN81_11275 [Nitrosomonadales bacterium]|nr:hypothetical protein [Nitrosomonadales bacterium]